MDAILSSIDLADTATYSEVSTIMFLLILAATALVFVSRWRIFKKLDLPGWKAFVPVYGDYTLFKNRWNLANGGVTLFNDDDVTSDMIDSKSSDMEDSLDDYGLEYQYTTVVFLSKTALRHYYKITDETEFNKIKDGITFDGVNVQPVDRGNGLIYFEKKYIESTALDKQYVLKIGNSEYKYSVMDYIKRLMESDNDEMYIKLAKATYRLNGSADTYFDDKGEQSE